MSEVSGARPVRDEDAFDVDAMAGWLRDHAAAAYRDDLVGTPEVRQFSGGASNLTYLLRYPARDLILRRPPAGVKAKSAHDMGREHRIQGRLKPVFPYVPDMVALCDDEAVIGSEFYVMERLVGLIPRQEMPKGVDLSVEDTRRLCLHVLDTLVALHGVDVEAAGLADLGRGPGYVRRQVTGWSDRYRRARTEDVPSYEGVMAWLDEHQPDDVASVLIHNDFRLDNVVLDAEDPTRVIGVLDWEMATIGDPLMDLAALTAYWVQADDDEEFKLFRRQPTHLPGMLTRAEVVAYYGERTGRVVTPEQWRFYEVFGLFRLGVIAQQIYYRYFHKQTTNELYAVFGPAVTMLEQRIQRLLA